MESGVTMTEIADKESHVQPEEVIVPTQYLKESNYFATIAKFLSQTLDKEPVHFVEYLENSGLIFISTYVSVGNELQNYLLVFDADGNMRLQEKIGNALKGLGLETFFLLAGHLFYVKNKVELVTYRIV